MAMPISVDPVLLAHAHANTIENARQLARLSPRGTIVEDDGLALIATGFPTAALNWAFVAQWPADPHAALVQAKRFFAEIGLPWHLVAWETFGTALAPIAAVAGFTERHPESGMLLAPLSGTTTRTPTSLVLQPVTDVSGLRSFHEVFAAAFGLPREGIDLVFNPALLASHNATFLLGWADDKPVGIGLGLTSHRIVGVFAIGVLPLTDGVASARR